MQMNRAPTPLPATWGKTGLTDCHCWQVHCLQLSESTQATCHLDLWTARFPHSSGIHPGNQPVGNQACKEAQGWGGRQCGNAVTAELSHCRGPLFPWVPSKGLGRSEVADEHKLGKTGEGVGLTQVRRNVVTQQGEGLEEKSWVKDPKPIPPGAPH